MKEEPNFELNRNQENFVLSRTEKFLRAAEISDYVYKEQLEPTQFMKDKIILLKNLLLKEHGLKFNFVSGINLEAGYMEIVISKT